MVGKKGGQRGVIDPEFLLNAYSQGFFPMANAETGQIGWYSPDPRTIIDLELFKISRSLRRTVERKIYEVKIDTEFEQVIRQCGNRSETWISEEIIQSYILLFELGFAHSVETWKEEKLAGGLYGVALGAAFFGESMYSAERDASKVALVALVRRLREQGFILLDTQFLTPHLAQFGALEIPRRSYLEKLQDALTRTCAFSR